jgi:hypothetical protein
MAALPNSANADLSRRFSAGLINVSDLAGYRNQPVYKCEKVITSL